MNHHKFYDRFIRDSTQSRINPNGCEQLMRHRRLGMSRGEIASTAKVSDGHIWTKMQGKPKFNTWAGLAFERVGLLHIEQIKSKLGINGVINICEMKYASGAYSIDGNNEKNLQNKIDAFSRVTKTRKAIHLTMVTTYGIHPNIHSGIVQ